MNDHSAAGNTASEVTIESAQRLAEEADRLFAESARTGALSDLARARSEIVMTVLEKREMVELAEADLGRARDAVARAVAEFDPVAADLDRVETELSGSVPAGDLESRLALRARAYALQEELEPLRQRAAELEAAVSAARNNLEGCERWTLPEARTALAAAEAALANPPLDNLAALLHLAPFALQSRVQRVGLALVNPLNMRTPHASQVTAALITFMAATGQWTLLVEFQLSHLKRKISAQAYGEVERALTPHEPEPQSDPFRPADRAPVAADPAWQPGLDPARLPEYGSSQAQQMVANERRAASPIRGTSWRSYPN